MPISTAIPTPIYTHCCSLLLKAAASLSARTLHSHYTGTTCLIRIRSPSLNPSFFFVLLSSLFHFGYNHPPSPFHLSVLPHSFSLFSLHLSTFLPVSSPPLSILLFLQVLLLLLTHSVWSASALHSSGARVSVTLHQPSLSPCPASQLITSCLPPPPPPPERQHANAIYRPATAHAQIKSPQRGHLKGTPGARVCVYVAVCVMRPFFSCP